MTYLEFVDKINGLIKQYKHRFTPYNISEYKPNWELELRATPNSQIWVYFKVDGKYNCSHSFYTLTPETAYQAILNLVTIYCKGE